MSKLITTFKFPSIQRLPCVEAGRMIEIEWKSSLYHSDGRPRSRPKASTVHGWLVKWRATFSGNEPLRKEGMREMREARAVRERKRQRKVARQAKTGGTKSVFRLWSISLGKRRRPQTPKGLTRISQHTSTNRPSRKHTRHPTSPAPSPRITPANSRRNHQRSSDRAQRNPRKASRNGRSDVVRVADKKR